MAKIIYLRSLQLYDFDLSDDYWKPQCSEKISKKSDDEFFRDEYLRFPVIVNENGSLWRDGNLYLLSFLKEPTEPNIRSLESIAGDLSAFWNWCKVNEIDYLQSDGSR